MDEDRIIQEMKINGVFNQLNAIYLSEISKEGQRSNIGILKPYKYFPTTKPYIIAADLVMEYLISFQFTSTAETIFAESRNSDEFNFDSRSEKHAPLRLKPTQEPIKELVRVWRKDITTTFYDNRERLSAIIEQKYRNLKDDVPQKKSPQQNQVYYYDKSDSTSRLSPPPKVQMIETRKSSPPKRKKSPQKIQNELRKKSPPKVNQEYEYVAPQQSKKQRKISPEQKKVPVVSRFQAVPQDSDSILDMSTEDSWRPPLPQNLNRKENMKKTSNVPFEYKPSFSKKSLNSSSFDDDIGSL